MLAVLFALVYISFVTNETTKVRPLPLLAIKEEPNLFTAKNQRVNLSVCSMRDLISYHQMKKNSLYMKYASCLHLSKTVRFGVFTAVKIEVKFFWGVTACSVV
jgi:hypothetical protein